MNLNVRYFAIFREATGKESEPVSSEASTPRELFAEMGASNPGLAGYEAALVAINDEMVTWESELHEGDEVLFFPPVAGG